MLTTAEASSEIEAAMPLFGTTGVSLREAIGRILHQSVYAERDQPPFNRVTMDGIAICYSSFASGTRNFKIQSRQLAGDVQQSLNDDDGCIEIMTGAVLPGNTDCVVPVERIQFENAMRRTRSHHAYTSSTSGLSSTISRSLRWAPIRLSPSQ